MSKALARSTGVVGSMTLLSRILGFVRDMVLATVFGAGAAMDAFFVAFKIPNFLRRLFAEGAFAQAFVPVISEYRSNKDLSEVRQLMAQVSGTLGGILVLVSVLGAVFAPLVIWIFAPGFGDEPLRFGLASDMLRLTFPYILFMSLLALAAGALNAYGYFAVPAVTPVLLNICLIAAALVAAPYFEQPVMALAWGVLIAGAAQLALQIPGLRKLGLLTKPRWAWKSEAVQRVFKLMLPAIFGSSVAQISLLFDTIMASFLVAGSVSWLYFADRLMEFPLGVFAIALSTVILPSLSRDHASADLAAFNAKLDWALRLCLLIVVPAAAGLIVLAGPLLVSLFHYGEFGAHDVLMARWALWVYGLGLIGFSLVKVLVPGYFARQDTKTPVKFGVIALLTNMLLNVVFVALMWQQGFAAPHMGLAMATITGAFVNAFLLWRGLRVAGIFKPLSGWGKYAGQLLLAVAVMIGLLFYLSPGLEQWLQASVAQRVSWLAALIVVGAGGYFVSLWLLGLRIQHLKLRSDAAASV